MNIILILKCALPFEILHIQYVLFSVLFIEFVYFLKYFYDFEFQFAKKW